MSPFSVWAIDVMTIYCTRPVSLDHCFRSTICYSVAAVIISFTTRSVLVSALAICMTVICRLLVVSAVVSRVRCFLGLCFTSTVVRATLDSKRQLGCAICWVLWT
jgi:hypothetical protein